MKFGARHDDERGAQGGIAQIGEPDCPQGGNPRNEFSPIAGESLVGSALSRSPAAFKAGKGTHSRQPYTVYGCNGMGATTHFTLAKSREVRSTDAIFVSETFFQTLGVSARIGQGQPEHETHPHQRWRYGITAARQITGTRLYHSSNDRRRLYPRHPARRGARHYHRGWLTGKHPTNYQLNSSRETALRGKEKCTVAVPSRTVSQRGDSSICN